MANDRKVVLLDDSPANADAFGPHQRIANAVRELVITEPGGRAIALIGTWGGGKSTVLNLLRNGPTKEGHSDADNLEIFVFDAWCHEGDPLRRTYLEKLINFLVERDWVPREKWEKRISELSGRYKETSTTSTPQLTRLGVFCAFLLFLIAIGLAVISGGTLEPWWIKLGFLLALGPVALIDLICIVLAIRQRKARSDGFAVADLVGYFADKQRETTKTETVESPEPTSVEFQAWFRELANDALTESRRLLIAVDNLDRVDREDALRLWSTLRTFVDFSENEKPTWAKKLWVLAAFDENGIRHLWEKPDGHETGEKEPPREQPKDDAPTSTFLSKSFQVRFRIPAPLLSDWRSFLTKQLQAAFPPDEAEPRDVEEFHRVSQIFAILKAADQSPTPRDIKVFVNQLGAAYRTSPEEFPLEYYALYVALSDRGWTPDATKMPEQTYLEPYLDDDWEEALVSLHYNMPKAEALHVKLRPKVERALTDGNADSLRQLADRRGIELVADKIIRERAGDWAGKEPLIIGRAAAALAALQSSKEPVIGTAFKLLAREAGTINDWKNLDELSGRGIAVLVEREKDPHFSARLASSLKGSSFPVADLSQDELPRLPWLDGLIVALGGVLNAGHVEAIRSSFALAKTPDDYIRTLACARKYETGRGLWEFMRPGCDAQKIIDRMADAVQAAEFNSRYDDAVSVMLLVNFDWSWDKLTQSFAKFQSVEEVSPSLVGSCARSALRLRSRNAIASQQIQSMCKTGSAFCHLQRCIQASADHAVSSLLLAVLISDADASEIQNPGANAPYNYRLSPINQLWTQGRDSYLDIVRNPGKHPALVEELVRQAHSLECAEELLASRQSSETARPVCDEILRGLAKNLEYEESFGVENVEKLYPVLRVALDKETLEGLLKNLTERRGLEDHLTRSSVAVETSGLYRSVLRIKRTTALTNATVNGLRALSQDQWQSVFATEGDLLGLMSDLVKDGVTLGLGYQMQSGLSAFSDQMLTQAPPKHMSPEVCDALFKALEAPQREQFKKNLRDKVINSNSSIKTLLILFGPILNDCAVLESKSDDLVRLGFSRILEHPDPDEYAWVRNVVDKCPGVMKRCDTDTVETFAQMIQGTFDSEKLTDECRQTLREIAKSCGVELTEKSDGDSKK
ncbi:MAG: P-loop NTPase fold protein [Verrucomicrobiia bacterium]